MKILLVLSLIFVCETLRGIRGCEENTKWVHTQIMDPNGNVQLEWNTNEDSITMKVTAKTTGWVGIGFSPSGSMKGADLVMGWVKDGKAHLQDRHALKNGRPLVDEHQDYELLGGSEANNITTICFRRKLNTCDQDDYIITEDTIRMLYSFNMEDPESEDYSSPKYHGSNRGVKSSYLLTGSIEKPSLDNVISLDLRMPNVTVPGDTDTIYWCKVFRLPKMETKHHMIGYKPYFTEGNKDLIHHLLAYECSGPNLREALDPHLNDKGYPCYTPAVPKGFFNCRQVIVSWAVGSEGIFLPPIAGYPLGDKNDGYYYLMFELHYNNPTLKKGVIDSSGLTIYYTKDVRQEDAGVLIIGHDVGPYELIPPNQESFPNVGHCSDTCTKKVFPESGLKAFGVMLHSHLLGKSMYLRHFRGGKELPPVAYNKFYDFNYQQEQLFQKEIMLYPGDFFTSECVYDSTKRNVTTTGGESTREEMCLSFVMYYPKVDMSWCVSRSSFDDLLTALGFNITGLSPIEIQSKYFSYLKDLPTHKWTEDQVKKAKYILHYNDKIGACSIASQPPEDTQIGLVNYPNVPPYVFPKDNSCKNKTKVA